MTSENDYLIYDDASQGSKKLDIYQHLKLSLKNADINCKCEGSEKHFYCIPCKVSTCSNCKVEEHVKHILICKENFQMNPETINKMYKPAIDYLNSNDLFHNYKPFHVNLTNNINEIIKSLHDMVNAFGEKKLKEIDSLFENFETNVANTRKRIDDSHEQVNTYLQKNADFFNMDKPKVQGGNSEQGNTIFLLNYDILTLLNRHSLDIEAIAKSLVNDIGLYTENQLKSNKQITTDIHNILFPPNEDEDDHELHYDKPKDRFIKNSNSLNEDYFADVKDRIVKYNHQIGTFRKRVLSTVKKFGNLKEIENIIAHYEKTKQKGVDNLFSKRKLHPTAKDNLNQILHITKKEELCLNNPTLEKYFAYLTIDLYGNYFKIESKELQASHADLMIKVNEDEDEEVDTGRAIEGTNEIVIYEIKNQKMVKKQLKLTKNPFGYTKFPVGCRSLLIGDKLYITGGKDETKEYGNVLIYDRKKDTLKRIMDLREARSFHKMVFNDIFETIMIVGGEGKNSVEIFDPMTNRWQLLPPLNYPRANIEFYFDESRGMMYAMFGSEGLIKEGLYSDVIEYLDLTKLKEGWTKMDYNNKASLNLKNYLNICQLNNELMLLYGGRTIRDSAKTVCILNLNRKEVCKITKNMMDTLRNEAKKNRKLSSIISYVNTISDAQDY